MLADMHANGDASDELVVNEIAEIMEGLEQDKRENTGYTYASIHQRSCLHILTKPIISIY